MAVFFPSRHLYTDEVTITVPGTETSDIAGLQIRVRTEREPYRFRAFTDNIVHVVRDGDTLWNLAGYYFQGFIRACGLWWVIADYQPQPIFDPTIRLVSGSVLYIPSMRVLTELIFSDDRLEAEEA